MQNCAERRLLIDYVELSGRMYWIHCLRGRHWLRPTGNAAKAGRGNRLVLCSSSCFLWVMSVSESTVKGLVSQKTGSRAVAHTLIFFYMLVSLNVAINSYDYTLLSLLISNQFVEIKGCKLGHHYHLLWLTHTAVFKKFEKENLFQIMCAGEFERTQFRS